MSDENQSGAPESVATSESTEQSSPEIVSQPDAVSSPEQEASAPETDKNIPFNEHPRFKELIEQKNQQAESLKQYENRMKELEARLQQLTPREAPAPKQENPLVKRLKDIDPEFGTTFEEVLKSQDELRQLREWRNQREQQEVRQQAISRLDTLYTQHKVADPLKEFYFAAIKEMAQSTPNAQIADVDKFFKAVHDKFSKFNEDVRRKDRESYVTDKKKDAAPATDKGSAAMAANKGKGAMSKADAISEIARKIREAKQI